MKTRKAFDCQCGTYDYKPHYKSDPHGSEVVSKPAHTPTPTPWIMCKPTPTGESLIAQDAKFVEDLLVTVFHGEKQKQIANAAFIIRAVNCHEELVVSLKALLNMVSDGKLVRDIAGDAKPDWALSSMELVMTLSKAQQAIAKAEAGR